MKPIARLSPRWWNTLHRLRANVLGVVLNEVKKEMNNNYSYYGYYGKYYKPVGQT